MTFKAKRQKLLIHVGILMFVLATNAHAQVKVCLDAGGKKTFTDYECEKIGLRKADVIQDINITPKQCPAIRDAITTNKESIAQHDATVSNAFNPGAPLLRNALVSQLEAQNLRYQRECVR